MKVVKNLGKAIAGVVVGLYAFSVIVRTMDSYIHPREQESNEKLNVKPPGLVGKTFGFLLALAVTPFGDALDVTRKFDSAIQQLRHKHPKDSESSDSSARKESSRGNELRSHQNGSGRGY